VLKKEELIAHLKPIPILRAGLQFKGY